MNNSWELPAFERHDFIPKKHQYCVIIPVLNEGERIQSQLKRMLSLKMDCDLLIIDGGSSDSSLDHHFLANHNVNSLIVKQGPGGLSAQLRIGLAIALNDGYRGVVLIDGNNKDSPEAIPEFVRHLDLGYDHIQGSRFIPGGVHERTPVSRLLAIHLIHAPLLSLAAGFRYTDTTNGFRAYSRRLLEDPRVLPFRKIFSKYELHYYLAVRAPQLGFKVVELPVERVYPQDGSVPTKISKFKGNLQVLLTLLRACLSVYHPKTELNPSKEN